MIENKLFIPLLTACITIPGTIYAKHLYDSFQKKRRLKKTIPILKSFIETNIISTLEGMINKYEKLKKEIREGTILKGSLTSTSFPWLNSKVLEYFSKEDLISILSKKDIELPSTLHIKLIELDFISDRAPNHLSSKFHKDIIKHFSDKSIFETEEQTDHYFSCSGIETIVYYHLDYIDNRIDHCKKVLVFFKDLINKI